ncbi:deoxyribodipyrimidine photolyase [Nocardioides sp. TRM66260-LWL]|uniref:FAD-binding domain-containing protein n=1 Tax=Nocardioides sp. TRM66260-LWL TaxID=2874478 RepID=UPI001CC55CAC|nr:FAD-binding domain-containing protein [Nocardioides sp. TRM66260-LWL]MBZ5733086.1 deoxyribodipyrimidine photolyase [Nocardioides sp. TRM66260-LWL]
MRLPTPPDPTRPNGPEAVLAWVAEHLGDLALEGPGGIAPGALRGGQTAADAALAGLEVRGYAARRSNVTPESSRGATRMSPYIRHGLLSLREVWDAAAGAPQRDREKYRDELLWQEYARHLYARVGTASGRALRAEQPRTPQPWDDPWPTSMACMDAVLGELHRDGWLVNQTRMWMASQWAVRGGADWRDGEDAFFSHLLDGSRAANRLGWQWTVGTGSAKPYGFSRWQVEKRAPRLCGSCALRDRCPIQEWPETPELADAPGPDLGKAPIPAGPERVIGRGAEQVWLTAESLGDGDPALAADDARPVVFVFDEPLLRGLRLSGKRLVFLAESLGDLAARRDVEVRRGRVVDELAGRSLAVTHAPVPGFARRALALRPAEVHPWPWLVRPRPAPVRSFTGWRKAVGSVR